MNVALIGSVSSSWYALDALVRAGVEVTGVLGVDESEAPRISDYRSLRRLATEAGLAFQSFVKLSEPAVETFLRSHPPDLLWVIGLSQLVPRRLIDLARHGGVGFHPTMLPEGRGRAPVAWTILLGARAAVNLFFLSAEPDAGDLLVQREVPVLPDDHAEDLIHRTNLALAEEVRALAPHLAGGRWPRRAQDHSAATHYAKRTPDDGRIDWSSAAEQVRRLIRAASRPYPGAFTYFQERKLVVWRCGSVEQLLQAVDGSPGCVMQVRERGVYLVQSGAGSVWLTETQWADGGPSDAISPGVRFG